jgi:hypothetical protein
MLTEITDPKYDIAKLKGAASAPVLPKETADFYAEKYLASGDVPSIGYGKDGAAHKAQILSRAAEMAKERGISPGDSNVFKATVKSEQSNLTKLTVSQSALKSFENTAVKNGDDMLRLAGKASLGGVPLWNRYVNATRDQIQGDPELKTFETQVKLFSTEVAKILTSPGLGGQLTDSARHEVDGLINKDMTLEQLRQVHAQLRKDFIYRDQSLQQEIDQTRAIISDPAKAWKPAATQDYKSSDDVVSAFKKGEITREKASELLKSMGHE